MQELEWRWPRRVCAHKACVCAAAHACGRTLTGCGGSCSCMVVAMLTGLQQQRATRSSRQAQPEPAAWACAHGPPSGWAPALLAGIHAGGRGQAPEFALATAGPAAHPGAAPPIAPPAHLQWLRSWSQRCCTCQAASWRAGPPCVPWLTSSSTRPVAAPLAGPGQLGWPWS